MKCEHKNEQYPILYVLKYNISGIGVVSTTGTLVPTGVLH